MSAPEHTAWVAVDWGTSHLRLWLMDATCAVIAQRQSDQGMGRLAPGDFAPALRALLADVPLTDISGAPLPVLCCGMVGARQGWAEAPYAAVPCAPPGVAQATRLREGPLDVYILPGVKQMSPPDVMRGEETQIAGFMAQEPGFDGVLCLPGTHTKWVHISAGEIVSFRSFMTGELYALLGAHSVLRHSVAPEGWDDAAFETALEDALARPADVAAQLFGLRAGHLLGAVSPQAARARLSGLLIGIELAAARPYWLGQAVAIIGAQGLAQHYHSALAHQGAAPRALDGSDITLSGLIAAYRTLKGPQ